MKRIYECLSFFLAILLSMALVSCVNEIFGDGEDMDGECNVSFELQGLPLQSALTRTAGNAIREVDNLYILFYTKGSATDEADYEFAYGFTTDADCQNDVFSKGLDTVKVVVDRTPGDEFDPNDGCWDGLAESKTKKVKISEVQIKRGSYAVYVVANVPQFSSENFSKSDIATVKNLRNYQLTWNAADVAANDAMFGFFTKADAHEYNVINESAPLIKITGKAVTLHAWVKRAVSKVTVAFDGSKLRDGVRVYIKNVRIHDIPFNCKLGAGNAPDTSESLIDDGEQIIYEEGAGATVKSLISNREPYFPGFTGQAEDAEAVAEWKKNIHSETRNALYFFENLQGKTTDNDSKGGWKQQTDKNGNGIPDDRDPDVHSDINPNEGILKDAKEYGTYVEVEAYYQNDNFGARTEGNIKYRFMLGKNTTNDFNAERNNHYKLTLCFRNNANDVDWHIDYSDKIGDYIPEKIYVSYEYNTPTILPIRLVGRSFTNLTVTINSSNWYPDDPNIPYFRGTTTPSGLPTGFLSLTYDENVRIKGDGEDFDAAKDAARVTSYWNNQHDNTTRKYIDNGNKVVWTDLEKHGYNVLTRTNSEGNTVFEANIPLFTRPLIIYKSTSWTGANPYYSSTRSAKITLSGDIDGKPFTKLIDVIQVPRIENPSGIYRRHDNTEPFDVTLMARKGEGITSAPISYAPYESDGRWRAIIYRSTSGSGNDVAAWFSLTAGAQKADATGEYLEGDKGEAIKFTFKPNGTILQNQVRCGIIKVEYNDYTCTHYILVRQGYAPMQLEDGKVYWHTFNLYSGSEETNHPCEAGSFFLRGHFAPAILDTNPDDKLGDRRNPFYAILTQNGTTPGTVSLADLKNATYARKDFPEEFQSLSNNNQTLNPWKSGRVPTLEEWATLKNEIADALIDKAFGVLYGDGVTETQTSVENVNQCRHADVNTITGEASKGMRGSFVYNTSDGRNIFLPIGASGHGRRKLGTNANGELQYGLNDQYWTNTLSGCGPRPLLYNLNTNEGAIYWAQSWVNGIDDSTHANDNGWDVNYKTFDFDYMEGDGNTNSACYIRLVQTTAP